MRKFFPTEQMQKMLRNHAIHCNNNCIIILFTKNFKQLYFCIDVSKEDIKVLCVFLFYRKITIFSIDYGVFESLDLEFPPHIKRDYQVLTCSNIKKLSYFSSSLCHPF